MSTKSRTQEKKVRVGPFTRNGQRIKPFRRRQKVRVESLSSKEKSKDKEGFSTGTKLAIGAVGAAAALGLTAAAYKMQVSRYRSGFPKSAEMAEELAKSIPVGKVKAKQQIFMFGVGGNSPLPDVQDGNRMVMSAKRAFSRAKNGADFKSIPVSNASTNSTGGKGQDALGFISGTADYYKGILKKGRNDTGVDLAANVIAYGDKFPDRQLVMMGHSSGGFAVHEAQEIIRIARPNFESRLSSVAIGSEYYGATKNFGRSVTIGSTGDPFTRFMPTKNLKNFNSVKSHSFHDYGTNPEVQDFVKDFIYKNIKMSRFNEESHPRLYEFSQRQNQGPKQKRPRKARRGRPISAQHRKAISKGLEEHHRKQGAAAKPEETRGQSIGKVLSNAGSGIVNAVFRGADLLDSLSSSAQRLGRTANSFANASNMVEELVSGSKKQKRRNALRQIALKRKQLSQKVDTGKSYGILARATRDNAPKKAIAALQNAASRAEKQDITKTGPKSDYWKMGN